MSTLSKAILIAGTLGWLASLFTGWWIMAFHPSHSGAAVIVVLAGTAYAFAALITLTVFERRRSFFILTLPLDLLRI